MNSSWSSKISYCNFALYKSKNVHQDMSGNSISPPHLALCFVHQENVHCVKCCVACRGLQLVYCPNVGIWCHLVCMYRRPGGLCMSRQIQCPVDPHCWWTTSLPPLSEHGPPYCHHMLLINLYITLNQHSIVHRCESKIKKDVHEAACTWAIVLLSFPLLQQACICSFAHLALETSDLRAL